MWAYIWACIWAIGKLPITYYLPLVIVGFIILMIIFMNFTFYRTFDKSTITTISKNISYSSIRDECNELCGLFFGYSYIGYIYKSSNDKENNILYCLCTENQFEELKKKKGEIIRDTDIFIKLLTRMGTYYNLRYVKSHLNCTKFIANDFQEQIIREVFEFYKENNNCVIMISGGPGTGKSSMGVLIAKKCAEEFEEGYLCKTFNPTSPGDPLRYLYNQCNPTLKKPLILLIDEFDILLDSFHHNQVVLHEHIPTEVYNKITWNNLFDDINSKLYPNLIVILTTNLTRENIEKEYDKSYIRPGRVNFYYNISGNNKNEISDCKNEISDCKNEISDCKNEISDCGCFAWVKN